MSGQPYVFRDKDMEELEQARKEFLFARKFDYNRFPELCRQVAQRSLNEEEAE